MVRIFKIDCTLFFQKGRQEICSQIILDDTKGKKNTERVQGRGADHTTREAETQTSLHTDPPLNNSH